MIIHEEKDICTICNKPFKWSKRNWVKGDMIEVELITAHAHCRSKCRALTAQKKKLEKELLEVEWELYKLSIPEIPSVLINGTYHLK